MGGKDKILYLILGIGIGIISANTLYSIYPKIEYVQLSDEAIIEKSRNLGMVSLKENIKVEKDIENNSKQEDKIVEIEEPEIETEPEIERQIKIEYGWTLKKVALELYEREVIDNKEEFIDYVKGKKLSTSIRVGIHTFKNTPSYDEIIEIITIGSK
jgi:hypothetical protein